MRSIEQLKERLHGKTAEEVVDTLASSGALDDHLARRCIAVETYKERFGNSDQDASSIQEDIAFELGTTRQSVRRYLGI